MSSKNNPYGVNLIDIEEAEDRRLQLRTIVTYIRTRRLRKLVHQLSEQENLLLHILTAHITPDSVEKTIDIFNQVVVYNKWMHSCLTVNGSKYAAEIVF